MKNSRDYFLGSKEAQNLTKEYREKLKKYDCSLSIRNREQSTNDDEYTLSFYIKSDYYLDDTTFEITNLSSNIIRMKVRETFKRASLSDAIDFVVAVSKNLGALLVVIETNENIDEIRGVRTAPISDFAKQFLISYTGDETFNYVNLATNYMENMSRTAEVIEELIAEQKEVDNTSTYKLATFKQKPDNFKIEYYKNGFKGIFSIECHKEILFFDEHLEHKDIIKDTDDLRRSFKELMEKIGAITKFSSLLKPPREHFSLFFQNKFGHYFNWKNEDKRVQLIDTIFDSLSENLEPNALETTFIQYNKKNEGMVSSAKEDAVYQKLDEQEYIELFKVLNVYFVADFKSGDADKYENTDLAYEGYRTAVLKKMRDKYTKKINDFEHRVQQLK